LNGGRKDVSRVLIVEDDTALSNGILFALKDDERVFKQAFDFASAQAAIKSESFDLIILDINLPGGSGLELLRQLRTESAVPIIILTANDLETDIISGFELGADDYITKPFSLMVLRARVGVQLRKGGARQSPDDFRCDEFTFAFEKMEFHKARKPVELSKTEQKLLRLLVENRGRTLQRSELVDRIWTDGSEYVDENALSVTVKRLRDKLEDKHSEPKYIKTVYGIGYSWAVV